MIVYTVSLMLMCIGIYTVLAKESLLKKVIGLSIFTNGIHLLLISLGYTKGGLAPILTTIDLRRLSLFVDPLPQALVLTSIVIDLSITALAVAVIIQVHRKFKTSSSKELNTLRG